MTTKDKEGDNNITEVSDGLKTKVKQTALNNRKDQIKMFNFDLRTTIGKKWTVTSIVTKVHIDTSF